MRTIPTKTMGKHRKKKGPKRGVAVKRPEWVPLKLAYRDSVIPTAVAQIEMTEAIFETDAPPHNCDPGPNGLCACGREWEPSGYGWKPRP